jgi:hypothetical protein
MKKITIEGKFTGSVNNFVTVDVYTPNSSIIHYHFFKTFVGSFNESLIDLEPNAEYYVDFSGYTTGQFELEVAGQFQNPNPLTKTYHGTTFRIGYTITTNS